MDTARLIKRLVLEFRALLVEGGTDGFALVKVQENFF
jgi:hypothetical protein